jgi:hypothetical protein
MTDPIGYCPSVAISVICEDRPDLIELTADAQSFNWRGQVTFWAATKELKRESVALASWARLPSGEFRMELGKVSGEGSTLIRFYEINLAGHIACHVKLASDAHKSQREESIFSLSLELRTEPELITRFAKQLERFTDSVQGVAVLEGIA